MLAIIKHLARLHRVSLNKDNRYNCVSYEAAKQRFLGVGLKERQANGVLELLKLIDSGAPELNIANLSDFENITGEKPTIYPR